MRFPRRGPGPLRGPEGLATKTGLFLSVGNEAFLSVGTGLLFGAENGAFLEPNCFFGLKTVFLRLNGFFAVGTRNLIRLQPPLSN